MTSEPGPVDVEYDTALAKKLTDFATSEALPLPYSVVFALHEAAKRIEDIARLTPEPPAPSATDPAVVKALATSASEREWFAECGSIGTADARRLLQDVNALIPYRDELLKIAEQVGEPGDPFAAWESIAALSAAPAPAEGWLYFNEDVGTEWSEQHPIESGECPDATDIRPGTATNLLIEMRSAWAMLSEREEEVDRLRNGEQPAPALVPDPTAEGEAVAWVEPCDLTALKRIKGSVSGVRIAALKALPNKGDVALFAHPPTAEALTERAVKAEHPDDLAVDRFAAAMKAKLAQKRDEGRGGWDDKDACSHGYLSLLLVEHVNKGDPVDIANFAMMLHQRGERLADNRVRYVARQLRDGNISTERADAALAVYAAEDATEALRSAGEEKGQS